ncbi:MAG: hypothetical protein LBC72_00170 [Spirochaetaceae bacterium]|jgi:membrane protein YdbS with pleckstrin-like domain|nr:hypothetical protein [Spirochaetaceae bacterium]
MDGEDSPKKEVNKKLNTLIFGALAVVCCVVLNALIFAVLFLILVFAAGPEGGNIFVWAIPAVFVVSIALSFFIYNRILSFILEKIDIEEYIDPVVLPWRKN